MAPSGLMARPSGPRLAARLGRSACALSEMSRKGFCGVRTPGNGMGASSTRPSAATWTRKGPNSSLIQKVPSGARTKDSGSRSKPVRRRAFGSPPQAAGRGRHGVEREGGSGFAARPVAEDRPGDVAVGVAEEHRLQDLGPSGLAPAGVDAVQGELEVGGVGPPGVAVVRQRPPGLAVCGDHARETLDRLRGEVRPRGRAGDSVGPSRPRGPPQRRRPPWAASPPGRSWPAGRCAPRGAPAVRRGAWAGWGEVRGTALDEAQDERKAAAAIFRCTRDRHGSPCDDTL